MSHHQYTTVLPNNTSPLIQQTTHNCLTSGCDIVLGSSTRISSLTLLNSTICVNQHTLSNTLAWTACYWEKARPIQIHGTLSPSDSLQNSHVTEGQVACCFCSCFHLKQLLSHVLLLQPNPTRTDIKSQAINLIRSES